VARKFATNVYGEPKNAPHSFSIEHHYSTVCGATATILFAGKNKSDKLPKVINGSNVRQALVQYTHGVLGHAPDFLVAIGRPLEGFDISNPKFAPRGKTFQRY
jgi:hypothetical protein